MREHFATVDIKLKQLLANENLEISEAFFNKLLRFLSSACSYEEEEVKIKPNLFITKNLQKHNMTNAFILPVAKETCDGEKCEKRLKSLMPFCNLGWGVYIEVAADHLEYGLIRLFSGPRGGSIIKVFSDFSDPSESSMVEIAVISNCEILINGMNNNKLCIDFRLFQDEKENTVDEMYLAVAEDIASGIKDEGQHQKAVDLLIKLCRLTRQKVHGAILLVVKESFQFPNEYLTDGIWLNEPIDLIETGIIALSGSSDIYTSEKYYGLSGLFMEMMNVDGITIIDNMGRIRGYNVFIDQSSVKGVSVSGGARKRAKVALLNSNDPSIIGVYFQSQDGQVSYERMNQE